MSFITRFSPFFLAGLLCYSNFSIAENWAAEEVLIQLVEIKKELRLIKSELAGLRESFLEVGKPKTKSLDLSLLDKPILGSKSATVMLIELSDYECPFCVRHHRNTYPSLKRNYIDTGKIQYTVSDFPLSFHSNAEGASIAARCAAQQSNSVFWTMHNKLFNKGASELNENTYLQVAANNKLNVDMFKACLVDPSISSAINNNIAWAQELGVSGTPAFLIGRIQNGNLVDVKSITGARPLDAFVAVFKQLGVE